MVPLTIMEDAMFQTTQSVNPVVQSIFGPGYVPERHADQAQPSLLPADGEFYFATILNTLRSALGVNRARLVLGERTAR
jgi:hypothetical protein